MGEQRMGEREAAVQRALAAADSKEAALKKDLQAKLERDAKALEEEDQRRSSLQAEAAAVQREVEEARATVETAHKEREAAERKREDAEAQLKLELGRRRNDEKKIAELAEKVNDLSKQLKQAQLAGSQNPGAGNA